MADSSQASILIIDDEQGMLDMLSVALHGQGYSVHTARDGLSGIRFALQKPVDLILCDLKMPGMGGLGVVEKLLAEGFESPIVMMSAFATVKTAVTAMRKGAHDFIIKPFKIDEILLVLERTLEFSKIKKENRHLRRTLTELARHKPHDTVAGKSSAIRNVLDQAAKVAGYDTTVLITGESGTGKELIARDIHAHSPRAGGPLIAVNCGSIPENLLESEFFGYARGAFTGADKDSIGLFEAAAGGTILLDEIGELPLPMQVKLLRVLQEGEIRRVGEIRPRRIDARVLAATAKDLETAVAQKEFREDLFFRIKVVEIRLPPLRERLEDILPLSLFFLKKLSFRFKRELMPPSKEIIHRLQTYHWPGNVRELENMLERAVIYADGNELRSEDFTFFETAPKAINQQDSIFDGVLSIKEGKWLLERMLIRRVLEHTAGNKSRAAEILEISYPSLLAKIKELDEREGKTIK